MEEVNFKCVAVVVTFNKLELLKECLLHLFELRNYIYRIVVVNNASTDGTAEFLNKRSEERRVGKVSSPV